MKTMFFVLHRESDYRCKCLHLTHSEEEAIKVAKASAPLGTVEVREFQPWGTLRYTTNPLGEDK